MGIAKSRSDVHFISFSSCGAKTFINMKPLTILIFCFLSTKSYRQFDKLFDLIRTVDLKVRL